MGSQPAGGWVGVGVKELSASLSLFVNLRVWVIIHRNCLLGCGWILQEAMFPEYFAHSWHLESTEYNIYHYCFCYYNIFGFLNYLFWGLGTDMIWKSINPTQIFIQIIQEAQWSYIQKLCFFPPKTLNSSLEIFKLDNSGELWKCSM